ncbi:heme exporter protein CcmD [Mesorhizobium sp. Z1-4]|uniref:heme exporter protein CcmD n=1 Tax=Mesorhizobium sp. Z1-4 TaxID=2448478 RepID=UPI000FD87DF4|nr:heme exporter protein CcmD [Mesorhizobium sp. Z1-4]
MTHTFFVSMAYGISALALCGLVGWIMIDQAARKRELAELEKRGVKRRSGGGKA